MIIKVGESENRYMQKYAPEFPEISPQQRLNDAYKIICETSIYEVELSVRSSNALDSAGVKKLGDVISIGFDGLKKLKNCGKKSIDEIEDRLNDFGLTLKHK